jgi:hypothetical protein
MVMWPAVSLLGFLVVTALVVLMGMQSTRRYEAEKQAASTVRHTVPESAVRATAAATAVL